MYSKNKKYAIRALKAEKGVRKMKSNLIRPDEMTAKTIIVPVFEDLKELSEVKNNLDKKFSGLIENNIFKNFEGKLNETLTYQQASGEIILALGLGKYDELTLDKYRCAISKAFLAAEKYVKEGSLALELISHKEIAKNCLAASAALISAVCNFKFDKYLKEKGNKVQNFEILTYDVDNSIKESLKVADIMGEATNFTRGLVFESAEVMTPTYVCEIAKKLADEKGLEINIFNKDELKEMGFNAFLAVGQGSAKEPKFFHLVYKGKNPKKKIALIGKGITFDSGGLDIKPASSMLTMKTDMTGCATVLGVMKAIAEIKPDIELHCMSALCENMPSGSSYKVGDVLTSKSGKTIEVDNTDAEGRLTLADVLTYSDDINADEVIDIATLTGAVIVALGDNITGIMGNNQEQIDKFKEVASKTGERVWQLPIYDDMMEGLKSNIADMKNTGPRFAGSSVAGRFLQNFTKSEKWLHIDIAGTAYTDKVHREIPKGATGAMVKTLVQYILR